MKSGKNWTSIPQGNEKKGILENSMRRSLVQSSWSHMFMLSHEAQQNLPQDAQVSLQQVDNDET